QRLAVDVVQGCARVALAEAGLQALEVGQFLQRRGGVAEAERLLAAERHALAPRQVGPATPQRPGQSVQLVLEARVAEGRLGKRGQLGALLRGERGEQPAGRRRPPGERVEKLLEVARPLWEEVAVALHELVEGGGGVLPAGVR